MVPRLEKIYTVVADQIYYAVLLSQPPRPNPRGEILEWFGFANARKWVAHDRFDYVESS